MNATWVVLPRRESWPVNLNALRHEPALKCMETILRVPNGTGRRLRFEAERRKCTGRLTNGPLHGMKPVAAIGDMSRPQVLAGGQQVLDALGYQSARGTWNGRELMSM